MTDPQNPFLIEEDHYIASKPPQREKRPTVQANVLDNYEPFNEQPTIPQAKPVEKVSPKVTIEDLQKIERDLEERTRKLIEEEEKLKANESKENIQFGNNFPPFPNFCPLKPCFHQDIDVEIPEQYKFIVRFTFINWMTYSLVLFLNIFGALSYMIVKNVDGITGSFFGLSILLFILLTPLSYALCFRPLYKAFKNNSSANFFLFFIMFTAQIIILIIQVLGINILGSCGWFIAITANENIGVKVFMLIIAIMFTIELACCFFIILRVNMYFRNSGASVEKAKSEINQEAVTQAIASRSYT